MKKILSGFLALSVCLSFAACSGTNSSSTAEVTTAPATTEATAETTVEKAGEVDASATDSEPDAELQEKVKTLGDDVEINFIFKHMANVYWQNAKKGAEKAAEDYGFKVNILAPITNGSNDEQLALIDQSIAQGTDAIVISPNDSQAILPACKSVLERGIPLVAFSTRPDDNMYDAYVGIENYSLGVDVSKKLAELGNNEGQAVIIEGPLGQQNSIDRADGAQKTFEDLGIEVVSRQSANWQRTEALALAQNILQKYPDVKYIFCCNDEMALGAAEATKQAGLTDVLISGIDASPEAVKAVDAGTITATCSQDPYTQAYICAELALRKLLKEDVSEIILDGAVVTKDNVADFLGNAMN